MEKTLFRGSVSFWNDLASKATDHKKLTVAFDVFVCTNETVDLASIAEVTRATGGQIYFYANYQHDIDYDKLYYDLKQNITRFTGFDGVMVIRLSKPLEVEEWMGAMTETSNKELILPVVTSDSTFCVKINTNYEALESTFPPCIQTAVMYTNIFGETMLKVLTLKLSVANSLIELFRRIDVHAVIKFSICQIATEMFNPLREETVSDCSKGLQDACVEIIYSYRKDCASNTDLGQLILPDSLRLLPLFTFSLLKHILLKEMVEPDVRVAHLLIAQSISCNAGVTYVYPHMWELHQMRPKDCTIDEETKQICWPRTCPLSYDFMHQNGLYLITNGIDIWLVWGERLSDNVMRELFQEDGIGNFVLIENPPEDCQNIGRKVLRLIDEIRWNHPFYQPLKIVERPVSLRSQDTTIEQKRMLVTLLQDAKRKKRVERNRPMNEASYIDFLVYLHKTVRRKIDS